MKKRTKIIMVVAALLVVAAAICGIIYHELTGVKKILPKETVSIEQTNVQDTEKIKLIAHRGLSSITPENTLASIKAAAEKGFYAVEFDIQLTSDNVWVVSHDSSMKKMTGVNAKIAESTLFELRQLDYNNGANIENYVGITIPTLDEVLDLLKGYDIVPVIEIKTKNSEQVKEFVEKLKEYKMTKKVWVISFNEEPLKEVKKLDGKIKTAYLTHKINADVISLCVENGFEAVDFNAKNANEKKVKMIVDAKLKPMAWTVDSVKQFEKFESWGVKYFTTNCILPKE